MAEEGRDQAGLSRGVRASLGLGGLSVGEEIVAVVAGHEDAADLGGVDHIAELGRGRMKMRMRMRMGGGEG